MEAGFLLDHAHANSAQQPEWAAGEPERSFFGTLKLRGRARYRVLTWRCGRCGLLESYALERLK